MKIYPSDIPPEGARFAGEEPCSILELEHDELARAALPILFELFARVASGKLVVGGRLSVELDLRCARCAEFFRQAVVVPEFSAACELNAGQEHVDLTPDIRECILLAIPAYPVCKPGCTGLCPTCGANLNRGPCGCKRPQDGRWSGLAGLTDIDGS